MICKMITDDILVLAKRDSIFMTHEYVTIIYKKMERSIK